MDVNYLAIIIAAVAGFVIGFVWYLPQVFGKKWMHAVGISFSPEQTKEKKGMGGKMVISFISVLISAFVLAHLTKATYIWSGNLHGQANALLSGIYTGLWVWLGFLAVSLLDPVLWQDKPWSLWLINAGQWLVRLVAMGAIIGYMM